MVMFDHRIQNPLEIPEDTVAVALVKAVLVVGFKDWVVDDVAER